MTERTEKISFMDQLHVWEAVGMTMELPPQKVGELRQSILRAIKHCEETHDRAMEVYQEAINEREKIGEDCDRILKVCERTKKWAFVIIGLSAVNLLYALWGLFYGG